MKFATLLAMLVLLAMSPAAQAAKLGNAYVAQHGEMLTLSTGLLTRSFRWNDGHLVTTTLRNEATRSQLVLAADGPDIKGPGIADKAKAGSGRWHARIIPADGISASYIEVSIVALLDGMELRRRCTLVPDSSAIRCSIAFKGMVPKQGFASTNRDMIESEARARDLALIAVDRLALPGGPHWRADVVRLQAATDYHDNLVQRTSSLIYREPRSETGALLHLSQHGHGIFALREAPLGADQIAWPGSDYLLSSGEVVVIAAGIDEAAADDEGWVEAYPVTIGLTDGSEHGFRSALRAHMATVRPYVPGRDSMIMSNSWGDRSRDSRMNEAFMLAEIERGAKLGLTVVQLDDGWQAGLSKNSASKSGAKWEDWSAEDWKPHPERFPRGLGPIATAAKKHGIALGIWFNPSQINDFAAWQRDADILIDLWRTHGINYVKIDGVNMPNRRAEANLVSMFDRVSKVSGGEIAINMDVTAGRRPAYFSVNRYGNIFLENRYTDWANYFPHRTLRNLWQLSAYVPPQWLQVEFLNVARNADKYDASDPLAPAAAGQNYAFAASWAAQPLAWMEVSGLDQVALEKLAPHVAAYRKVQTQLHDHAIFPIGNEPDGGSITGFQSLAPDKQSGFLLIYREPQAPKGEVSITTLLPAGRTVVLDPVIGAMQAGSYTVGTTGRLTLPAAMGPQATLLQYRIVDQSGAK